MCINSDEKPNKAAENTILATATVTVSFDEPTMVVSYQNTRVAATGVVVSATSTMVDRWPQLAPHPQVFGSEPIGPHVSTQENVREHVRLFDDVRFGSANRRTCRPCAYRQS